MSYYSNHNPPGMTHTISLILIIFFLPAGFQTAQGQPRFVCPPCDLPCDTLTFSSGGKCPVCHMELTHANAPRSGPLAVLQDYDGEYEYRNGMKLLMVASAFDSVLYACLDEAWYPLSFVSRDIFTNVRGDTIRMRREHGQVTAFSERGDWFSLLRKNIPLPETFPRKALYDHPESYQPATPDIMADGLATGKISEVFAHPEKIREMVIKTIRGDYPQVHSILIYKDGKLVLEEYFYGYDRDQPHQLRSASKSFEGALVGLAIDQGVLGSEKDLLLPYFDPIYQVIRNRDSLKNAITLEDFLTYRHGMDCSNNDPESKGNEMAMMQSEDWVKYTLDLPMVGPPGHVSSYCTGCPLVLGSLVEYYAGEPLEEYARKNLFAPMGITTYEWRFDPDSSSRTTFSQMYLRPRDLVKLGVMYLDEGKWQGRQILPAPWVEKTFTQHDPEFGFLWRFKTFEVNGKAYRSYLATGNGGQKINIWPDLHMVTVFTGGNYNSYELYGRDTPPNEMIPEYILRALE